MDGKRVFGFALRTFGLVLLVALPAAAFALIYVRSLAIELSSDEELTLFVFVLFPAMGLLSLMIFSILGTLLPAYVAGHGRGIGAAIARGRRQFFWLAGRLLVGFGILYALSMIVIFLPAFETSSNGNLFASSYAPNPTVLVSLIVAYAIQVFAIVLAAVALSRAFLRDQVRPDKV